MFKMQDQGSFVESQVQGSQVHVIEMDWFVFGK